MTKNTPWSRIQLNWQLSVTEIHALAQQIMERTRKVHDQVASIPVPDCTFHNVVAPLAHVEGWETTKSASCYFPQYVHSDKAIRDASLAANKALEEHAIELGMREDVYRSVKAVYDKMVKQPDAATSLEDQRLVTKMELQYRRNGLGLPSAQRDQMKSYKKRLSQLCIDFQKNINEDSTHILVTADELDGLPADFLAGLPKQSDGGVDKYMVTMKYPSLFPVLNRAKRESTRKMIELANTTRCHENIQLLEEALVVRNKIAQLLGYPDHAAYAIEVRMAKSSAKVEEFLVDLGKKLRPLAEKELKDLMELKRKEKEDRKEPFDGQFHSWDFRYYNRLLLEEEYNVDEELIKDYFSLDTITDRMLDLYQRLFGLKFTVMADAPVWHEDVQLYEVKDRISQQLVGYFYLDLFPRDGKYTHAACFGLQPGCILESGERQYPVAAMVANFTKPQPDRPSCLKHNEVVTYYHELGHVIHQLCSQTKWSRFHGTKVERDFVEAPSQMLENWCWEPSILYYLSGHFERRDEHGQPERISAVLCEKMMNARNVNAGLMNLRQVFFATFDLTMHREGPDKVPRGSTEVYRQLREDISLISVPPDTYPLATFGHMMGGYDAGYYGYLWSQVFSADMYYTRFKKEGIENEKTGSDYRQWILRPGGSVDGMDMLKNFLGREPNSTAFLASLGLQTAPSS